jgi:RNA-splicing ligase RtcB
MPYEKVPIGGAEHDILSWANHPFSQEEQAMLRNVSRLPCLFKHVALMPDAHLGSKVLTDKTIHEITRTDTN